jgi:hypothetical protein
MADANGAKLLRAARSIAKGALRMFGMNLFCLAISAVYVGIVAALAKSRGGNGAALVAAIVGTGAAGLAIWFFPVLFLNGILACLAVAACAVFKASPRYVLLSAIIATIAAYWSLSSSSRSRLQRREEMRAEFPLVSLSDRLAYERQPDEDSNHNPPQLGRKVETELYNQERIRVDDLRRAQLEFLHDRKYDEFVRAGGFGFRRMSRVDRIYLLLPDSPRIPLDPPPASDSSGTAETSDRRHAFPPPPRLEPETDDLFQLHRVGRFDFLDPQRMGYVRDRDHVAGFLPHAFSRMPQETDDDQRVKPRNRKWRITRLELVSLLKHKTPVAYLSENLPRMDDLKTAPTRPLTDFETAALKQLRREKDLVVKTSDDRIVMLGSLRAGKNCLQCHSGWRGELLGAFSYELFPEPNSTK